VIRLRQQTPHDLVLQLSMQDCEELLASLGQLENAGHAALNIEVHASVFKIKKPRIVKVALVRAGADHMGRDGEGLTWVLEPDSIDEIVDKVMAARRTGYFMVAELATVKGPHDEWLRLYAELQS
jgi:hypothetical protein